MKLPRVGNLWKNLFGDKVGAWLGSGVKHAMEGDGDVDLDLCPSQFTQCFSIQHQEESCFLCAWFHHHTQQHTCST